LRSFCSGGEITDLPSPVAAGRPAFFSISTYALRSSVNSELIFAISASFSAFVLLADSSTSCSAFWLAAWASPICFLMRSSLASTRALTSLMSTVVVLFSG
jgi:hypothetical protein